MFNFITILIIFLFVKAVFSSQVSPQENYNDSPVSIDMGVDVVSRYVWRGLNVNDAPNIQPAISFTYTGFTLGLWGSYALTADSDHPFNSEIDLYTGYSIITGAGTFSILVTDYYFPDAGYKLGNFNNYNDPDGAGGHLIEAGLTYQLPESFPLSISGYYNVYNDAGKNTYFQLSYPFNINNFSLTIFTGAAGGSSENPAYYNSSKFAVINAGFTLNKDIKITDNFILPVFSSFIINPRSEQPFLIFGISF